MLDYIRFIKIGILTRCQMLGMIWIFIRIHKPSESQLQKCSECVVIMQWVDLELNTLQGTLYVHLWEIPLKMNLNNKIYGNFHSNFCVFNQRKWLWSLPVIPHCRLPPHICKREREKNNELHPAVRYIKHMKTHSK